MGAVFEIIPLNDTLLSDLDRALRRKRFEQTGLHYPVGARRDNSFGLNLEEGVVKSLTVLAGPGLADMETCWQLKDQAVPMFPYDDEGSSRARAPIHKKFILRKTVEGPGFLYTGSHNMNSSCWGQERENWLLLDNHELGVVVNFVADELACSTALSGAAAKKPLGEEEVRMR